MQTRLTDFLRKNNATTFWILDAKTGEKLSFYSEATTDEAEKILIEELEFLTQEGNYKMKVAKSSTGFTNAKEIRFRVGEQRTQTNALNSKNMNFDDLERIRKEAYNEGIKYGKELSRIDALELRCSKIEEKVNQIINLLEANGDDDEDNDMNASVLKPLLEAGMSKVAKKMDSLEF